MVAFSWVMAEEMVVVASRTSSLPLMIASSVERDSLPSLALSSTCREVSSIAC